MYHIDCLRSPGANFGMSALMLSCSKRLIVFQHATATALQILCCFGLSTVVCRYASHRGPGARRADVLRPLLPVPRGGPDHRHLHERPHLGRPHVHARRQVSLLASQHHYEAQSVHAAVGHGCEPWTQHHLSHKPSHQSRGALQTGSPCCTAQQPQAGTTALQPQTCKHF